MGRSAAHHGRGALVAAAAAILLMLGAPAPAYAHARAALLTRAAADRIALQILAPGKQFGRIVVLGLNHPLAAGAVVSQANLIQTPAPGLKLKRRAWLFWEDLAHGALFEHASVELLIDAHTGAQVALKNLSWYPLVNGKAPAFLQAGGDEHPLYSNIAVSTPVRSTLRAIPELGGRPDVTPLARAATAAMFTGDCLFQIGDRTTTDPVSRELFEQSFAAVTALANNAGLSTADASTYIDLGDKIHAAVDGPQKCKDVIIFIAGHGSPGMNTPLPSDPSKTVGATAVPTVSLGAVKHDNGAVFNEVLTSYDLRNIMNDYTDQPNIKFKLMIFSCFSGRFVEALKDEPNLAVISTSSNATQYSWGYVGTGHPGGYGVTTGPELDNPMPDPNKLPGYVAGMVSALQAIIDNPTSFTSYGGDMAKIIYAASLKEPAGDFSAQLGWVQPLSWLAPVRAPTPTIPTGPTGAGGATGPAGAQDTIGSLADEADDELGDANDTSYSDDSVSSPVDGQVLSVTVQGMAVPSTAPGAPAPNATVLFQDLRPQSNGSVSVINTSQAFTLPDSGSPAQQTTFEPTNMCIQAGDHLGLSTEGGFQPTYYPNGTPFLIFSNAFGASSVQAYSLYDGDMNGANFLPVPMGGTRLLMQATIGTGDQATGLCPGGTAQ